jgi:hypothetical protein
MSGQRSFEADVSILSFGISCLEHLGALGLDSVGMLGMQVHCAHMPKSEFNRYLESTQSTP